MKPGPPPRIRHAESADDDALVELSQACDLALSPVKERALDHSRLLVACSTEEPLSIAGFALLWLLGEEAELIDLGVAPELRRRGTARLLLRAILEMSSDAGAGRVFLEVRAKNLAARTLYESLGFEECGLRGRYYSDGEDAILYQCCLSPPL